MKNLLTNAAVLGSIALLATTAQADCGADHAQSASAQSGKNIVETAVAAGTFQTLAAALTEADLVNALQGEGPFTVFAPTDDAFAKLPAGTVESLLKPENRERLVSILTYHVVPGKVLSGDVVKVDAAGTLNGQRVSVKTADGTVSIDNAKVTAVDILASNGVIHVIDTVLLPESETIVGVAANAGTFNTLLAAAKAADLAETLMSDGPFTVFAPTDDAFAKLPAGTVESLLQPENVGQLRSILKYHVVAGRTFADEVVTMNKVGTLAGMDAAISVTDGVARIGDAKIVATDIDATNGVIHVIDTVLLPAEKHSSVTPDYNEEGTIVI
jgi:uncharacterized surface protein with fasciclin (FAS1) repeats